MVGGRCGWLSMQLLERAQGRRARRVRLEGSAQALGGEGAQARRRIRRDEYRVELAQQPGMAGGLLLLLLLALPVSCARGLCGRPCRSECLVLVHAVGELGGRKWHVRG